MKYLTNHEKSRRHSKTNLTLGAFGTPNYTIKLSKVFKNEGKKLPLATPPGKIPSTYMKHKVNKHSKDYSKGK